MEEAPPYSPSKFHPSDALPVFRAEAPGLEDAQCDAIEALLTEQAGYMRGMACVSTSLLALDDLDRALARSPEHLGALTGRAMALMALGRDSDALSDLRSALALNPWLKERDLVPVLEHRLGASDI